MQPFFTIAAAVMMMACLGGIYAWSLLVPSLQAGGGFSALQTQLVFGTVVGTLCAATLVGGPLQERFGPRKIALSGAALYAGGYLIAAYAGGSFALLWLGAGLMVGVGTGVGYISSLATAVCWLPQRKGLVTGLVVGGYGSGAIFSKELFETLLDRAWEAPEIFVTLACGYGAMVTLCAANLRKPKAASPRADTPAIETSTTLTRLAVLHDRRCWQMFLAFFFGNLPGLLIIGSLAPIAKELGHTPATAAGAITALAIGNCTGRILWGAASDRLNGFTAVTLSLAVVMASVAGVAFATATLPAGGILFMVAAFIVGLGFASCLVLHAAQAARLFGAAGVAVAYPMIFQAHGLSALLGPAFGGLMRDLAGSYKPALAAAFASSILAFGLYVALARRRPASDTA